MFSSYVCPKLNYTNLSFSIETHLQVEIVASVENKNETSACYDALNADKAVYFMENERISSIHSDNLAFQMHLLFTCLVKTIIAMSLLFCRRMFPTRWGDTRNTEKLLILLEIWYIDSK